MQSPSPWSIKGIPPEAREIAKAAAAKEGITLGEWFKRRILEEFEEKQKGAAKTTATTQKPSKPKTNRRRPTHRAVDTQDGAMADALGGIVAVLQTMQDQQKSANDAAAAKAEARIANAEAAIKTVATHIGDRFERYEKEAAARHARQSEQMRGQMRDEMRNKVGDAAEQVDQRDDAIRTLAKSVETTALRGAASDTAIRRIAETVQALDNSLHATREQAAETVVAVERLAAKNATPAEDVVAQIFMDPRLQTMIRAVVREAIEEIVMSDEADEDDAIDIPANDADAAPDKAKTAFPAQGQDVFMGWSGPKTRTDFTMGAGISVAVNTMNTAAAPEDRSQSPAARPLVADEEHEAPLTLKLEAEEPCVEALSANKRKVVHDPATEIRSDEAVDFERDEAISRERDAVYGPSSDEPLAADEWSSQSAQDPEEIAATPNAADDDFDVPTFDNTVPDERDKEEDDGVWQTDDRWRTLGDDAAPAFESRVAQLEEDEPDALEMGGEDDPYDEQMRRADELDAELDALLRETALEEFEESEDGSAIEPSVVSWDNSQIAAPEQSTLDAGSVNTVAEANVKPEHEQDAWAEEARMQAAAHSDLPRHQAGTGVTAAKPQREVPPDAFGSVGTKDAREDLEDARFGLEDARFGLDHTADVATEEMSVGGADDATFEGGVVAADHRPLMTPTGDTEPSAAALITDAEGSFDGGDTTVEQSAPHFDSLVDDELNAAAAALDDAVGLQNDAGLQPSKSASEALRRAERTVTEARDDDYEEEFYAKNFSDSAFETEKDGFEKDRFDADDHGSDAKAASDSSSAIGAWRAARAGRNALSIEKDVTDIRTQKGFEAFRKRRSATPVIISTDVTEQQDVFNDNFFDGEEKDNTRLGIVICLGLLVFLVFGMAAYIFLVGG